MTNTQITFPQTPHLLGLGFRQGSGQADGGLRRASPHLCFGLCCQVHMCLASQGSILGGCSLVQICGVGAELGTKSPVSPAREREQENKIQKSLLHSDRTSEDPMSLSVGLDLPVWRSPGPVMMTPAHRPLTSHTVAARRWHPRHVPGLSSDCPGGWPAASPGLLTLILSSSTDENVKGWTPDWLWPPVGQHHICSH